MKLLSWERKLWHGGGISRFIQWSSLLRVSVGCSRVAVTDAGKVRRVERVEGYSKLGAEFARDLWGVVFVS